MNAFATLFLALNAITLVAVPRRWAAVPLILCACYMPLGQGVELGPFSFTVIRILVAVGVLRVVVRREPVAGGLNGLDWLMVSWAIWACLSSAFHKDPTSALVFRLGLVYNAGGIYLLLRIFCSTVDDVERLCIATAWLLMPIALEMAYEHVSHNNLFSILGADSPVMREGRLRAVGPFSHPILAGTVGAVSLPLMAAIWRSHRTTAVIGVTACVLIVLSSASSGPFLTGLSAIAGLLVWRHRNRTRLIRWLAVVSYVAIDLVMDAPAYYLFSRIDLVGGSTGWHRARLMQSAFEHLGEWWVAGTDYTRHWMGSGVDWSPDHTDITNYYLSMGVVGGLPLMLLFVAVLVQAFSYVGRASKDAQDLTPHQTFVIWALGAQLFAHVTTSFSVAYFDQSFLFFYLTIAAIGSVRLRTEKGAMRSLKPTKNDPVRFRNRHDGTPAHAQGATPLVRRPALRRPAMTPLVGPRPSKP